MKVLIVLSLLVMLFTASPRPDRVFDGQVVRVGELITVVFKDVPNDSPECKTDANKDKDECKFTILDIPKAEYPKEWKVLEINTTTGEVVKSREPEVGDVVKVQGVNFTPIEPCEVRRDRNVHQWVVNHPGYSRMPLALLSLPDDCQPWYKSSWQE